MFYLLFFEQSYCMSDFSSLVYGFVSSIPRGHVATYGYVARGIGCGSAQAVGQALSRNPHDYVPCYRVIRSDGFIGGFFGSPDFAKKRELLISEGVVFDDDGYLLDFNLLLSWFSLGFRFCYSMKKEYAPFSF